MFKRQRPYSQRKMAEIARQREEELKKEQENIAGRPRKERNPRTRGGLGLKWPLVVLGTALVLFGGYKVMKGRIFQKDNFQNAYANRFEAESPHLNRLDHVNKNFVMDNNYLIGSKYVEKGFYQWNDKTEMTFDKSLSLALREHLTQKKLNPDNISITIISSKNGDRFSLNGKTSHNYPDLDKLLTNMVISKMLNDKLISSNDTISVKESDLTAESVFLDKSSIGLTFEVKELMKLSFVNDDIPARNMLKRYVADTAKISFNDLILKEFGINIAELNSNTNETSNVAREFQKNKNLFRDLTSGSTKKKVEGSYLKYIVKDSLQNFFMENDSFYYDFGVIDGPIDYIYSIYTKGYDSKSLNEIGDILDRKLNEYYLQKNI